MAHCDFASLLFRHSSYNVRVSAIRIAERVPASVDHPTECGEAAASMYPAVFCNEDTRVVGDQFLRGRVISVIVSLILFWGGLCTRILYVDPVVRLDNLGRVAWISLFAGKLQK